MCRMIEKAYDTIILAIQIEVSLRIQSACGKMRNNSKYGHFLRSNYDMLQAW